MVIQQYQDPSVSRWLKFGFWYQERKPLLAKTLIGLLLSINALFWAYTLYGAATLVAGMRSDERLYAELAAKGADVDVAALHQAQGPEGLVIDGVFALPSAGEAHTGPVGRADFLALVSNPNPGWIMRVSYSFQWEGTQSGFSEKIVLPESQTFLARLGEAVSGVPDSPELITTIAWQRVRDPSILVRPAGVLASIRVETSEVASRGTATDISAIIANESPYTVITPSLLMVATRFSGEPAGAWVSTQTIGSGERIQAQRRFARPLPAGLEVSVYPDFDLFDEGAYRLRGAGNIPF
ncbi:MAG: hypothetical protein HYT31_03485 [Parcubacteria group bacterium]|nr:hypothetical protein [Parcubacteria group bacterium]